MKQSGCSRSLLEIFFYSKLALCSKWIQRRNRAFSCIFVMSCGFIAIVLLIYLLRPISSELNTSQELGCRGQFLKRLKPSSSSVQNSAASKTSEIASMLGGLGQPQFEARSRKEECGFHHYTKTDTVECFDSFRTHRLQKWSKILGTTEASLKNRPLHIAFVGDSRIRQLFFSVSQVFIPFYDVKIYNVSENLHTDIYFSSHTLNLILSYSWRPSICKTYGENLRKLLQRWLDIERFSPEDPSSNSPDFLVIGIALHDMSKAHNDGVLDTYADGLLKLKPLLNDMATTTRVIWLNTYSMSERNIDGRGPGEYTQSKIPLFNQIVLHVLQDSRVEMWDTTDPIVEEHVRACTLLLRDADYELWGVSIWYQCMDVIHAGNVAVNPSTHLLLNEICNSYLRHDSDTHKTADSLLQS